MNSLFHKNALQDLRGNHLLLSRQWRPTTRSTAIVHHRQNSLVGVQRSYNPWRWSSDAIGCPLLLTIFAIACAFFISWRRTSPYVSATSQARQASSTMKVPPQFFQGLIAVPRRANLQLFAAPDWKSGNSPKMRHFGGIFKVVDTPGECIMAHRWRELSDGDHDGQHFPVVSKRRMLQPGSIFVAKAVDVTGVRPWKILKPQHEETMVGVVLAECGQILFRAQHKSFPRGLLVVTEDPARYVGHHVKCNCWEVPGAVPLRVVDVIRDLGPVHNVTDFVIQSFKLQTWFSAEALQLMGGMKVPPLGTRVDLRSLPLVTMDGVDARDFDDAVWAEKDTDAKNTGGWHLVVAIADVSHYVQPNDAVDVEAYSRGNSVYFPDRCIPMLPEKLSNDLCSLRPLEDRACIGVHIWIDHQGRKLRYQFFRGLMRSAARLTYSQVEDFLQGKQTLNPAIQQCVSALHGAYCSLKIAREARNPLEASAPEIKVAFGADGHVVDVSNKVPLESEAIVEEFMILANVCAAEFLQLKGSPCPFRVHSKPTMDKIAPLLTFMKSHNISTDSRFRSALDFNELLQQVKEEAGWLESMVALMVLRSQEKAIYSPNNSGHFGLNLQDYCHFTSPIRRYSDLLVHRLLSDVIDGTSYKNEIEVNLEETCIHISEREIQSMQAEWDSLERFAVLHLQSQIGREFSAFISGVGSAGLFVTLETLNVCGLVPMDSLPPDFYLVHNPPSHLEGRHSGRRFVVGEKVEIVLVASDLAKGKLIMKLGKEMVDKFTQNMFVNRSCASVEVT